MKRIGVLCFLFLFAAPVRGQYDHETLSGLVLINDQRPGNLARLIEVEARDQNRPASAIRTDVSPDGEYHFNSLSPATYIVTARAPGYKPVTIRVDLVRGSRARGSTKLVLMPEIAPAGNTREGGIISQNELRAPKAAVKEIQKAEQALEREDLVTAAEALDKALGVYPRYARALFQKGRLLEKQQQVSSAAHSYEEATQEDRDYFPAYQRLSEIWRTSASFQNLKKTAARWKKVQPLEGTPRYYFALALFEAGEFKPALEEAIMAKHFPHDNLPHLNLLLANCYVKLREPQAAMDVLKEFLELHADDPLAPQARSTLAEIQKLAAP